MWKWLIKLILGLISVLVISLLVWWYSNDKVLPLNIGDVKIENEGPRQVRAGVPYWDQQEALVSYQEHAGLIDHLYLFWYVLRENGSISAYPDAKTNKEVITDIHARGGKVYALIANLALEEEGGTWSAEFVEKVISNAKKRQAHIKDIVILVEEEEFDGVTIDYETLTFSQRSNFTFFIRDLSKEMHSRGKIVGVALHSKVGEGNPRWANGSQAQDWKRLAKYADHLSLMSFEQHWSESKPGPASSPQWLEPIVRYALRMIPANKLFVGVPLYGYDWGENSVTEGLTYVEAQNLLAEHGLEPKWVESEGSYMFRYEDDGEQHEVWFEDSRSVAIKLDLLDKLGVRNLTFWRLGNEDKAVWPKVDNWKN